MVLNWGAVDRELRGPLGRPYHSATLRSRPPTGPRPMLERQTFDVINRMTELSRERVAWLVFSCLMFNAGRF